MGDISGEGEELPPEAESGEGGAPHAEDAHGV